MIDHMEQHYQPASAPELDPHALAMAALEGQLAHTGLYRAMFAVEPQAGSGPVSPLTYEDFMYPSSSTDLAARQRFADEQFADAVQFGLLPAEVRAKLVGTLLESRVLTQAEILAHEAEVERTQVEVRRQLARAAAAAGDITFGEMMQLSTVDNMRNARVIAGSNADGSGTGSALPRRTPVGRVGSRVSAGSASPSAPARVAAQAPPTVSPDTRPPVATVTARAPRHAIGTVPRQSSRPSTPRS